MSCPKFQHVLKKYMHLYVRFITGVKAKLVSCLACSSTLKMEVTCFSEMSVDFQRTTRRYIPEDRILYNHRCENLKSYSVSFSVKQEKY
jgi:hypothetical protein